MTKDTPKQRLVGRRRPPPIDALDPLDPLDGQTYAADDTLLAACIGGLRPARHTLPRAALAEALGAAGLRRLREGAGLALVVEVPSPDWATHVDANGPASGLGSALRGAKTRRPRATTGSAGSWVRARASQG
jgi:hypothetical protein